MIFRMKIMRKSGASVHMKKELVPEVQVTSSS